MKIATILGARPQFIKAAAVSRELAENSKIKEVIIHTGQHWHHNMSEVFFKEMEIPQPDYNLDIHNLGHGAMTGQMLEGIEKIIINEDPDLVMVYGDTNSTLAGALAAKKLNIKLAHVEAGLRSNNMRMPEEINRILTDRISDLLFCPTDNSIENLKIEGFGRFGCRIKKTGDVMLDAALYYGNLSSDKSSIINRLELGDNKFVLCTIHRQENTDNLDILKSIIKALNRIHHEMTIILPLHPRTKKIIDSDSIMTKPMIINPVGYFDMVELLKNCSLVITDSGGVQKEAFFFKKNCLTIREQTEWVELVDRGYNILVGTKEKNIFEGFQSMIKKKSDFDINLYGNGKASKIIVEEILK